MINSNLFLILAQTYVKLLHNDVIAKGLKLDFISTPLRKKDTLTISMEIPKQRRDFRSLEYK
jgi:hypothetical protein